MSSTMSETVTGRSRLTLTFLFLSCPSYGFVFKATTQDKTAYVFQSQPFQPSYLAPFLFPLLFRLSSHALGQCLSSTSTLVSGQRFHRREVSRFIFVIAISSPSAGFGARGLGDASHWPRACLTHPCMLAYPSTFD
ncbi:hypothetical protein BGY98DRAFT_945752 [Russula aff. rugulosa BPL654]|nr:hypothetical protein BGY98DRAFT_945752 [Russula aff. rugulosa BPL654]